MKKDNKCAIRSILAILLCAMLVTSNMGTVAFAVERSLAQMDAEEAASGPESDGIVVGNDDLTPENDITEESAQQEPSGEEYEPDESAAQEPAPEDYQAPQDPTTEENKTEGESTPDVPEGSTPEDPQNVPDAPVEDLRDVPDAPAEDPQDVLEESAEVFTKTVDAYMSEESAGGQDAPTTDGNAKGISSGISYLDEDGTEQSREMITEVTEETTEWNRKGGGWYVVTSNVRISERIIVSGSVHLILCDGAKLTASSGIEVNDDNALTIYAQSTGSGAGSLTVVSPGSSYAGIGGGNGTACGTVTINGGRITSRGGYGAAGIGSGEGDHNFYPQTGTITINGGEVTATGGQLAAGIGGGYHGQVRTITINGGTVKGSTYGDVENIQSAGIGGGCDSIGGTITINGGTVVGTGGYYGAGIGSGSDYQSLSKIILRGGNITAERGKNVGALFGDIILDWTDTTASVRAESIRGSLMVRRETLADGSTIIPVGEYPVSDLGELDKKTLTQSGYYFIHYSVEHGEISADKTRALPGEIVTFTAKPSPADSYALVDLYVTAQSGERVPVENGSRFAMPACDVVISAMYEPAWCQLQREIDLAQNGETITLNRRYVATDDDIALQITGKKLTIDLNGWELNRNLTAAEEDGSVIHVAQDADLTIKDSGRSGTITGGYNENGGGIYCEGTLTINGGYISNNKATDLGGGIYLPDYTNAVLNLNGGEILSNTCGIDGGGIEVTETATMTLSGEPVVATNQRGSEACDVTLAGKALIKITGKLGEFANVYVNRTSDDGLGIITSGYSNHNTDLPGTHLHADASGYAVVLRNSEGMLAVPAQNVSYITHEWDDNLITREVYTQDEWLTYPEPVPVPFEPDDEGTTPDPASVEVTSLPGGMYVLNRNVIVNDRLAIEDDTWLILCDDYTLDVMGLYVPKGKTLTIYGQTAGTGRIYSHPSGGAAIGGYSEHDNGKIVIHGGTIDATGYDHCAGIGSNDGRTTGDITIYGGKITATGGKQGAGIGAGRDSDGGTIRIYGGNITATGKDSSAGIGGSDASGSRADFSTIRIYGGTITATGNSKGSGIGGGEYGSADITISGGNITATGGSSGGAGIGSGVDGTGSTITITGGTVNAAVANNKAFGIGDGKNTSETSTITLGYTDYTRDDISITAHSFGGNVEIQEPFRNDSYVFDTGVVPDNDKLKGSTLVAWDTSLMTWAQLQLVINDANDGKTISLTTDFAAAKTDTCLKVPSGKNIVLDLNGHTLDRNLKDPANGGCVIKIENGAKLTIRDTDGNGAIKGGRNTGNGGGINNEGTLSIESCIITDCVSMECGGGICNKGTLTITGGTITSCDADGSGGGICVVSSSDSEEPKLLIKGHPVVEGNTCSGSDSNITVDHRQRIQVAGPLDKDVVLGVILSDSDQTCSGVFTTGLNGNGSAANFKSDDNMYAVELDENGEAVLVSRVVTVKGVTGSFNDRIKLNYYFEFPETVLRDKNAYVTITNKDNSKETVTTLISEAEQVEGKGYKFSIELAAKEASDNIIANVYDGQDCMIPIEGGTTGKEYTGTGVPYTLMKYFEWLEINGTGSEKAVGAAAKDYCTAAQLYFDHKVTEDMSVSEAVSEMREEDLNKLKSCAAERSGKLPDGVSIKGISAMLESDNTFRLYYSFKNVDPTKLAYAIGGKPAELKQRTDGAYYLALDAGVYSNRLQDTKTYSVSDGTNTYTITASVLTYARSCVVKSNATDEEINLGKALYLYNVAAVAAFGTTVP